MDGDAKLIDAKLFQLCAAVVREGLAFVDRSLKDNHSIKAYEDWPEITWSDGIPDFTFGLTDAPLDYKDAFNSWYFAALYALGGDEDRRFDFEKQKTFQELKKHVRSESFPKHVFPEEMSDGLLDSALAIFIKYAIDRFIHGTVVGDTSFDSDRFLEVYLPLEAGLLLEDLPIEIHVPILLVSAAADSYDLDDRTSVIRMSEPMQLARAYRDHNTHDVNENLLHQASHALVLREYTLPNSDYRQRFWGYGVSADAVDLIDTFFACLRITAPFETGYAQVLFVPLGWAHSYQAKLPPMQGITIRKYPPNLHPMSTIDDAVFPKRTLRSELFEISS